MWALNQTFLEHGGTPMSRSTQCSPIAFRPSSLPVAPSLCRTISSCCSLLSFAGVAPMRGLGYFHHIPFPPSERLSTLNHAQEILEGLWASDLIGVSARDRLRKFSRRGGASEPGGWVNTPTARERVSDFDRYSLSWVPLLRAPPSQRRPTLFARAGGNLAPSFLGRRSP